MTPSVLPRSLDPLPHESLPSYILRLAHRLERTPGRIAQLTGLTSRTGGEGHVPASAMLYLDPDTAAEFARAARLSPAEVAALCMNRYAARYPPLDFGGGDPRRRASNVARSTSWVSTSSTRYCPQCLARGRALSEQGLSGDWQQPWRLPIVVACTVHQRILLHLCPQCEQPGHFTPAAALLPRMGDLGLHPAQCRSTVRPPGRWAAQPPACGAWLDTPTVQDQKIGPEALSQILGQQRRLLDALRPDGGIPQATARDLTGDLITLIALLQMSWPVGGDLVPAGLRTGVDDHVQRTRQAVEQRRGGRSGNGIFRPLRQPPADPSTCAGLVLAVDKLLGLGPRELRDAIAPMLDYLGHGEPHALYLLRSRTACSAALRAALTTHRGGFYLVTRTHACPAAPGRPQLAPRHIPQFLPLHLYDRHLKDLRGISAKLLRRAACFKLFELTGGGTWIDAVGFFQIPITTARSTLAFIRRWTTPNLVIFEDAVESIAQHLETGAALIDYQARRRALATWSIPTPDWQTLVAALTAKSRPGRPTVYDDRKQRIASVMVWAQITQGEHLFAPLVIAEKQRHGTSDLRAAVTAILYRSSPKNADLRAALAAYAHRLCLTIDNSRLPGPMT